MRVIFTFQEKRDLIASLIELMKKEKIDNDDKEKIYNVVVKLQNKTNNQKERFIRFFGLKSKEFKRETLKEISQDYKCTPSAIRCSVTSVRIALYRVQDDDFQILADIYQKYQI